MAADPIVQFSKIQRSHCCVCVFRTVYRYQCYTGESVKIDANRNNRRKKTWQMEQNFGESPWRYYWEITQEKEYSHLAIRNALNKVQYLPKQDRAFINRLVEGTLEYMLRIDYVLNQFSSVRVNKMKPVIRNILRSGVYQLMFMDSVPDPAACNEAVKLAQKKGFYSLKGFVNGVMRNVARKKEEIIYPDKNRDPEEYLSVYYSVPQWLVKRWVQTYGTETTECMLKDFLTVIR